MSFASTLATPGAALTRAIPGVLRGSTLAVMSRTVGIVVGAGMLAAVYQVTQEETKVTLSSWRERRRYRVARHEALLIVLLVSAVALVGLLYAGQAQNEIAFLCFAFLVGFGGGAFYPMFASLTPDYFGSGTKRPRSVKGLGWKRASGAGATGTPWASRFSYES